MKQQTKKCTKCKKYFPSSLEFFYKDKNKKDGLTCRCKGCCIKYNEENKKKIAERQKNYRKTLSSRKDSEIPYPTEKTSHKF